MKKWLLLICFAILAIATHAEVITICADNWCPYNCDTDSDKPGYVIEIAKQVFAKSGITVEYKIMPWTRAIAVCRTGEINAIVGAAKSDAPDFVFPSNSLGQSGYSIFVTQGATWTYTGIASLKGKTLGVINDYAYTEELDAYIKENRNDPKKIQVASGIDAKEINIKKLQGGRIDAFVESPSVMLYALNKMGLEDKFKMVGMVGQSDDLYIAFSPAIPKSKDYAKILSDGVAALRKSGALATLLSNYGLKDWKK